MKKPSNKFDPNAATLKAKTFFIRYRIVIFVAFVSVVYVFMFIQIMKFSNPKPSPLALANQSKTSVAIPRIDPKTIAKIQQLQDNSVSVQALFNQARQNPFTQ